MANSFTGTINTNGEFISINQLTGLTLTSGKTYSISVQNMAYLKIDEAVFPLNNEKFTFVQGSDVAYIKSNSNATLTILENI